MTRHPARGVLLVLLSSICFGVSGAVAKALLTGGEPAPISDELGPLQLVQMRITGAAVLMLLALAVARRRGGSVPPRRKLGKADLRLIIAYGLVSYLAIQVLYFFAIQRMPVGVTLLIEYLAPVLVIGWAVLVQRRRQAATTWWGVVLALAGLVVLVQPWHGFALEPLGALAALLAAAGLAGYFLMAEAGAERLHPLELAAYGAGVAAVVIAVVAPWWNFPFHVLTRTVAFAGGEWPAFVLVGIVIVVGTVLSYLFGVAALVHLSAPVVSVLATLEVVFASIASWLLIEETLAAAEIVGGAVLLAGAVLAQAARNPGPVAIDSVPAT